MKTSLRRLSILGLLLLLVSTISPQLAAQGLTVRGRVVDSKQEAVIGASIFVKNSKGKGSVTNAQGEFTLSGVARNAILRISFIGMKTEEVALAGRSELTIILQDEATKLEDVVVVG